MMINAVMTKAEVMDELKRYGNEQTRKVEAAGKTGKKKDSPLLTGPAWNSCN